MEAMIHPKFEEGRKGKDLKAGKGGKEKVDSANVKAGARRSRSDSVKRRLK